MLFQLTHEESVNFALFTQDDKYVATVCLSAPVLFHVESGEHWTFNSRERSSITANAGVAQLWNATTGRPLAASWNLGTWVSQVGISRDGLKAIPACSPRTLTENQVSITKLTTGVRLPKPLAHLSGIIYSAFSPNGKLVVTASWDHKARVWDADSGQPVSTWLAHAKAVHCAEFSPDSRLVATASEDGTARVWDAVSGEPVTPPLRHEAAVHSAFFSPNGRRLLTTSVDGEVHVWELPRGTKDEELLQARFLAGQEIDETGSVLPLSLDVFRRSWRGRSAITTAQNANSATSPNTPNESEQDADLESSREAFEKAKEAGEARRREARAAEDRVLESFSPTQEQWVKLIEEWSKAIQAEPEESADFRHRSIVCERAGRYRDGIDDMREFLWKRGPVPPAQLGIFYLELGEMRLRLGESEKANADFKKVLETPPDESDCLTYYWRALAHEHFGQFQQAIDELGEAIKRPKPSINSLPQFHFDRARNYLHLHEYAKAKEDLEMTDRKDPRDRLALAWWYLTAPGVLRSPEKAQSLALEALELSRGDRAELGSWELLARFLALDGEPPQPNRTPLNTLGVAYYESGNFAQAIETLEGSLKAQSEAGNSVQSLFFLAMSYQSAGASVRAQQYYIEAQVGDPAQHQLSREEQDEIERLRREAGVLLGQVKPR
jgi:tetratricopeptide (TPR) repeat protein